MQLQIYLFSSYFKLLLDLMDLGQIFFLGFLEIIRYSLRYPMITWLNDRRFSGLTIVRITKKQVREVIEKRMRKEYSSNGVVLNRNQEKQVMKVE